MAVSRHSSLSGRLRARTTRADSTYAPDARLQSAALVRWRTDDRPGQRESATAGPRVAPSQSMIIGPLWVRSRWRVQSRKAARRCRRTHPETGGRSSSRADAYLVTNAPRQNWRHTRLIYADRVQHQARRLAPSRSTGDVEDPHWPTPGRLHAWARALPTNPARHGSGHHAPRRQTSAFRPAPTSVPGSSPAQSVTPSESASHQSCALAPNLGPNTASRRPRRGCFAHQVGVALADLFQ
jgi:hypothetical protein